MIGKLVRVSVALLVLGSLTGCDGCKRSPPVTERSAPAAGAPVAAQADAGTGGAWARGS